MTSPPHPSPEDKGFKFWWHKMATRDAELTPAQYRVLMAVWDCTDEHGRKAFPGRDGIALGSACGARTVDRALPALTAGGYLVVANPGGRSKGGRKLATVYALGIPTHWREETPANVAGVSEVPPVDNESGNPRQPDGGIEEETPANESETPAILTETPANESLNPRHDGGPIRSSSNPFFKSANQIRPTSPSPSSPAPVDNSCLLEGPDESGEPDTTEAYDALDRLQANESTPETPDYLAGLDAFAPLEPTDEEEWDDTGEPIDGSEPDQPDNVGRINEIQGENNQEHQEAPVATLARFRSRGHPARAQELASAIADGWRVPE